MLKTFRVRIYSVLLTVELETVEVTGEEDHQKVKSGSL